MLTDEFLKQVIQLIGMLLTLLIWLRGWSGKYLPFYAWAVWGSILLMSLSPLLIPGDIQYTVMGLFSMLMIFLSLKCLIIFIWQRSILNAAQRRAAYFGLSPFVLSGLGLLWYLWQVGYFSSPK